MGKSTGITRQLTDAELTRAAVFMLCRHLKENNVSYRHITAEIFFKYIKGQSSISVESHKVDVLFNEMALHGYDLGHLETREEYDVIHDAAEHGRLDDVVECQTVTLRKKDGSGRLFGYYITDTTEPRA